ncbi:MAG: hypothetical protein ACXVDD_07835, partial [Polyangia bacterium]
GAIDRAPINSSSAISSFTLSPVKLAAAGTGPGVVVGNYFYIIAGSRSQHAPIRPDGTLGDFTADSAVTASGLLAVLGNYVYALNATQPQRAAINDDGTLAPFANVAVTGKTTVTGYSLIVSGATLYSISGGTSSTDPVNTVEAATVAANGSLAFSTSGIPAVNFGHMRGSAVLLGGNIFSFAGYRAGDGYIDNAERGALNASAAVTAWANTGNRYGDFDTQTAVVGTELLIVAGAYNANAVQQCPVTDTGLAFTQLPSLGKSDRRFPGALVTNSYLYLTGGYNNAATSAYDSIEQAALK